MASGIHRGRMDQFFASKKIKIQENCVKNGSNDNSPSKKRSLDNFLVSLDHVDQEKGLRGCDDCETSGRYNEVQKRLILDSSLSDGAVLPDEITPQPAATVIQEENTDLKKFAEGFLSLFCSELQSNQGSPLDKRPISHKSEDDFSFPPSDKKTPKKRRCTDDMDMVQFELSRNEKDGVHGELDKSLCELKGGIKKCTTIINSAPPTKRECLTPIVSGSGVNVRETPKSGQRNSLVSPGESFWNEAIQVVDCLFAPKSTGGQNVTNDNTSEHNCTKTSSSDLVRGEKNEHIKKVSLPVLISPSGLLIGNDEELGKGALPLPVKHFDFSSEEDIFKDHKTFGADAENKEAKIGEGVYETIPIHEDVKNKLNEVFESVSLISAEMRMNTLNYNDRLTSIASHHVKNFSTSNTCEPGIVPSLQPSGSCLDVSNWVPPQICSTYKEIGISKLFPWQVDCLNVEGVLDNKNLVYCASTSAGKSFVAEILMIRRIISTGKMALLVLPYVSICVEKAEHLEALLEPIGKHVRSFFGNQGGSSVPNDTSVAVCTIEKANIIVNRLLEEGRLSEVGIIVIDELHMVGDSNRGYLLELLLTKLRYASGGYINDDPSGEKADSCSDKCESNQELQIVGMSATMPNVSAVAQWLQAALYQTDFRPVPLEEFFKVGNSIYNNKMEVVRTLKMSCDLGGKDPDHIVELCNEVVEDGNSVLVFCSSRKGCESTAKHVAKFLTRFSASVHAVKKSDISDVGSAIDALEKCPVGLDPILQQTIPHGVAFHHAGLTVEEREIVETCYRNGLVRVLAATSTLAAGVNLPARRVIFRQPKVGREFIDGSKYKQMSGRAGRSGIDSKGESLLICKKEEVKRVIAIINEGIPPLASCLSEDKNGMTHAILEVVASGIVQTANDIHRYVRCTLLNCIRPFEDVVKSAQDSLRWLCHRKFLEWNEKTKLYNVTPLGRASFGSSLCPEESLLVLDDLSRAREGFVLASDLHLVYLVTPINVDVEPDWELYYEKFLQLSALDQSVGNRVGVAEQFLMRFSHGGPYLISKRTGDKRKMTQSKSGRRPGDLLLDDQLLRVCKRFYVALILSRLVQEEPVSEVCEAYKVSRGIVQSLQENAGRFASMISVFCERLGWFDLEVLVAKFQNRVSFGVRAEIVELTTIPHVKGSRARALYKAGLRSTLSIAEASVLEIVNAIFHSKSWTSEDYMQRGIQFGTAKKIKNAARKIIFDKAEEARVAAFSAFKSLGLKMEQLSGAQLVACSPNVIGKDIGREIVPYQSEGLGSRFGQGMVSNIQDMEGQKSIKLSGSSLEISDPTPTQSPPPTGIQAVDNLSSCSVIQNSENILLTGIKGVTSLGKTHSNVVTTGDMGPVNAVNAFGGIDSFLDVWESIGEFCFDMHFSKKSRDNCHLPFELHGMALCWEHSSVYYVDLPKDLLVYTGACVDSVKDVDSFKQVWELTTKRWNRIGNIFGKTGVKKLAWNLKVQIQVLKFSGFAISRLGQLNPVDSGVEFVDGAYLPLAPVYINYVIDLSIVAWILWPDEGKYSSPNLEKEAKKRLSSEDAAAAHCKGRWNNQMSEAAHNGCCRRVAQIHALCSIFFKILVSEGLLDVVINIEMPLVHILAEMEVCGVGIEMEKCLMSKHIIREKLINLEKEAYELAGMSFSLYTPADIANVLFTHMKLPFPDQCNKGKRHLSTDKYCLDILRHEHPIVAVIMEHRVLAKLKNNLSAVCSLARKPMCANGKHTLHGRWLQTSTGTGRLSMEEPNLQCIEHSIEFKLHSSGPKDVVGGDSDKFEINVRDFFIPTRESWLILTADYSQIELCVMAHFSKDQSLIDILSRPDGDLFSLIVVRWMGKSEEAVTSSEREQTKKLIYGILYGMGANKLSKQLECSLEEAVEKIRSFKNSFPDVSAWLLKSIDSCRQNGYITTLKGRKRFLPKIRFGTPKEKLKAQRQAVNSICQGSAADIIKIAMINMYSVISGRRKLLISNTGDEEQFGMLKNRCRLLLQMHDELVIEADPSVVKQAGLLLKSSMETATSLLVPLKVKMMIGKTWGTLKPFEVGRIE